LTQFLLNRFTSGLTTLRLCRIPQFTEDLPIVDLEFLVELP